MAWLIENVLEEGKHGPDHPESKNLKTAGQFYVDRGFEAGSKIGHNYAKSTERLVDKGKKTEEDFDKAIDAAVDGSITGDMKKLKDKVKESEKFANANYKIDAIDRHNRRHPEAKVANESGWLIESVIEPVNEGLLDRFKKRKSNEKEDQKKIEVRKQNEPAIKAAMKKAFDEYVKVLKAAIAKTKTDKVKFAYYNFEKDVEVKLKKTTDKFFELYSFDQVWYDDAIVEGELLLFAVDIYKFGEAIGIPAREMEYEPVEALLKPVETILKEYKPKTPGVKYIGLDKGCDWDDYCHNIAFTNEFFDSIIK